MGGGGRVVSWCGVVWCGSALIETMTALSVERELGAMRVRNFIVPTQY